MQMESQNASAEIEQEVSVFLDSSGKLCEWIDDILVDRLLCEDLVGSLVV